MSENIVGIAVAMGEEVQKYGDPGRAIYALRTQLATAQAEIAGLKKDAERLDFMIEHTDSVFKIGDGRYVYVVEYSVNEFSYHAYAATSREAIDAAIEAEGRKE